MKKKQDYRKEVEEEEEEEEEKELKKTQAGGEGEVSQLKCETRRNVAKGNTNYLRGGGGGRKQYYGSMNVAPFLPSAVRKHFPKVMYLDGQELPKAIGFEVEEEVSKLPPILPPFFVHDGVKEVVLKFIEQYYQIFDSDNRRPLEAAYTEDALFSLSCIFPDAGPAARYSGIYVAENRNLKKITSSDKRQKQLVQGRANIINTICNLPMTLHDPGSFTVDIPVADPRLMNITLSGVYRQVADRAPPVRFFTRSFTIVPEGSGYCICNEQLFLTSATVEQIKKSFKNTTAAPQAVEPVPAAVDATVLRQGASLSSVQEAMIIKFSEISGMLPHYSQQCLEQNGWDFEKAGNMFLELKNQNKIPPEYFPANA